MSLKTAKRLLLGVLLLGILCSGLLIRKLNDALMIGAISSAVSNRPVVVIDAGHGGSDGGAQSNGINEKEINLAIAKKEQLLCQLFGFQVIMTRDGDYSIHDQGKNTVRAQKNSDLHNRLKLMTSMPDSVTISIHLNKFPESYVHGAQVFYAPKSKDSDLLAEIIQNGFKQYVQPDNNRKIKKADSSLFLLYNNTVTPAVLVECGFISNPNEAEQLKKGEYQDRVSMAICHSLMKFYNRGEVTLDGAEGQS